MPSSPTTGSASRFHADGGGAEDPSEEESAARSVADPRRDEPP